MCYCPLAGSALAIRRDNAAMSEFLDRLMQLWADPPADDATAAAAFREFYADPVPVNGAPLTAAELVARARALHVAAVGTSHLCRYCVFDALQRTVAASSASARVPPA